MSWWRRFFAREAAKPSTGFEAKSAFMLHSADGKREVEVLELRDGQTYLIERDLGGRDQIQSPTFRRARGPVHLSRSCRGFCRGYRLVLRTRMILRQRPR